MLRIAIVAAPVGLALPFDTGAFEVPDIRVVVERDAVEAEIGSQAPLVRLAINMAALDVIERGRAKRQRRLCRVLAAAHDVDVSGIIGTHRGRDWAVIEKALVNRQYFTGAR